MPTLINLANADVESEYNLEGYDAYDSAGTKLGDIDGVIVDGDSMEPRYVVVDSGGWFSSKRFVVPAGDIREIDEEKHHVSFKTLTKQTLASGTYPRYDESWWDTNAHDRFRQHEQEVARAYQPEWEQDQPVDYGSALYQRPSEGAQRLQLLEERLRVEKEREQAGVVRLGKRITERTETVTVPVREEHVVIERRPVTGEARATDAELREGETLEVPVMKERVTVAKEAVVAEEVNVRTEAVERQEQVRETVRKEELAVEDPAHLATEPTADPPRGPASRPQQ